MAETDEPKPEQAEQETPDEEEELEEVGWPGWLTWGLVIVAAVFGGYLLGSQTGGKAGPGEGGLQLDSARQLALAKQQQQLAMQRADQVLQQYMQSFCREMIRIGLFRDGLEKNLSDVKDDLDKVAEQLAAAGTKPEERLAKATEQLKKAEERVDKVAARYGKHAAALKRVGQIGTTDQAIAAVSSHIGYLYVIRITEMMGRAQAGDQRARQMAQVLRARLQVLDRNLAAQIDKQFPELAAQRAPAASAPPATKPALPGAKAAPPATGPALPGKKAVPPATKPAP